MGGFYRGQKESHLVDGAGCRSCIVGRGKEQRQGGTLPNGDRPFRGPWRRWQRSSRGVRGIRRGEAQLHHCWQRREYVVCQRCFPIRVEESESIAGKPHILAAASN